MNLQVNMFHPAHVHLFKNFIRLMRDKGHKVVICARNKEVTHRLLKAEGLPFHSLGDYQRGFSKRIRYIVSVCGRLRKIIKREHIDYVIGVSDMYGGLASKGTGAKAISFTDTDHARLINFSTRLFADVIVTPKCCTSDFGTKQLRYDGYHELAYLHPNYFCPDASVRLRLNLKEHERFLVFRLVAWEATHDAGHDGIDVTSWLGLIKHLSREFRVFISSESELPTQLRPYAIRIPPDDLHNALAFAHMFVGEGATMASESAVLGTPAVYVNALEVAYCTEQEERYHLVHNFRDTKGLYEKVLELSEIKNLKAASKARWEKMLAEKVDVTEFMVRYFERSEQR